MICIISGFQNRISALQFEHGWQHAFQTRHIAPDDRIVTTKRQQYGKYSIDKAIGNLRLLGNCDSFLQLPLQVHIFEDVTLDCWNTNKYDVKCKMEPLLDLRTSDSESIGGGLLQRQLNKPRKSEKNSEEDEDKYDYFAKSIELYGKSLQSKNLVAVCPYESCFYTCLLTELARLFITDKSQVLPKAGQCPKCSQHIQWWIVAKNAHKLKQYATSGKL